jgi:CDP-4-dehydro-6-deoxyglucose reductase
MLLDRLSQEPDRRFILIFGVRYEHGLLYREEWEDLARRHSNFTFLPTLTRPEANWTGATGRVQSHVLEALGPRLDMDIYICGLKEMVNDVRGLLKEKGVDRKRIVYERYD